MLPNHWPQIESWPARWCWARLPLLSLGYSAPNFPSSPFIPELIFSSHSQALTKIPRELCDLFKIANLGGRHWQRT